MKKGLLVIVVGLWMGSWAWAQTSDERKHCSFASRHQNIESANPYLILIPGWELVLEAKKKDKLYRLEILVLDETRMVDGVETRLVRERESTNGALHEESFTFLAVCQDDQSVWSFGEESVDYVKGKPAKKSGWMAGAKGAARGLAMPGTLKVGQRFYLENAPGVEVEQRELVKFTDLTLGDKVYKHSAEFKEVSEDDDHPATVVYAPGIGLVQSDEGLTLVSSGWVAK